MGRAQGWFTGWVVFLRGVHVFTYASFCGSMGGVVYYWGGEGVGRVDSRVGRVARRRSSCGPTSSRGRDMGRRLANVCRG